MAKAFNRKRLAAFIQRRKINALGLTMITAASAIITLLCALIGFRHTDILAMVTIAMVALSKKMDTGSVANRSIPKSAPTTDSGG